MGKKTESIRVTSIARRINFQNVARLLGMYIVVDLFVVLFFIAAFVYASDAAYAGKFSLFNKREIFFDAAEGKNLADLVYCVSGYMKAAGENSAEYEYVQLYTINIGRWVNPMLYALRALFIVELIQLISLAVHGTKRVRENLKPLNEIAARAQALGELAFDESKYRNLEDAISKLKVETIDAGIHMHDKDLRGIETALNGLLERIRTAYKQQAQFVSDASHELRTPIAVIQGYVNMLDRWGKEDEAILEESIEAIKNESNHMQKLVEQLLFLARGDSNRQSLDIKRLCLNDIMREVYEESVMIDEAHHYIYEETGSVYVNGDSDMLKQSARILIDNAAKYTKENEDIIIKVGEWRDYSPYYSIQDNGIGMNAQGVEHAFDRFYRADAVRSSKTGGTGLGLSIAKWIVDKHNAYYDIVSREGLGTRFSVIFPRA